MQGLPGPGVCIPADILSDIWDIVSSQIHHLFFFLRVNRENLALLDLRASKGLLVEAVYQEPLGQEGTLVQRFVL